MLKSVPMRGGSLSDGLKGLVFGGLLCLIAVLALIYALSRFTFRLW